MNFKKEFLWLIILTAGLCIFVNFLFIKTVIPLRTIERRMQTFENVRNEVTTVFLGNSYADHGINPSLLPHSVNLADGGYSYPHFLYQIKKIYEKPNSVKTIVIVAENLCYSNESMERHMWDLSQELSLKELEEIFHRSFLQTIFLRDFPIIGQGFEFGSFLMNTSADNSWDSDEKIITKLPYSQAPAKEALCTNAVTVEFFNKVVDFLKGKNVKLVFVAYPFHPDITKKTKDLGIQSDFFRDWYVPLTKKYDFIYAIDASNSITGDENFDDYTHLNKWGAIKFTQYIGQKLREIGAY